MTNETTTTRPDTSPAVVTVDDLRAAFEASSFTIEGLRDDMIEDDVQLILTGLLEQIADFQQARTADPSRVSAPGWHLSAS